MLNRLGGVGRVYLQLSRGCANGCDGIAKGKARFASRVMLQGSSYKVQDLFGACPIVADRG